MGNFALYSGLMVPEFGIHDCGGRVSMVELGVCRSEVPCEDTDVDNEGRLSRPRVGVIGETG